MIDSWTAGQLQHPGCVQTLLKQLYLSGLCGFTLLLHTYNTAMFEMHCQRNSCAQRSRNMGLKQPRPNQTPGPHLPPRLCGWSPPGVPA
jgi:hypothetical protein